MKTRSLSLLLCVLVLPLPALASSFAGTSAGTSSNGSSASSDSSSDDDKQILDARDDAAGFVASDGKLRSARLEAALIQLRERSVQARSASDMTLARAILVR